MVGNESDANNSPSQNNNANSYAHYLTLALQARNAGDVVLALHLYLAAYERALQDSQSPDTSVIEGLRQAWKLACESKERSLAEYIFEKLEPYLTQEEVAGHASMLQRLALEKLEEFGLSRDDIEDMTDMLSQDFFGLDPSALIMQIEQGNSASSMFSAIQRGMVRSRSEKQESSEEDKNLASTNASEAAEVPDSEVLAPELPAVVQDVSTPIKTEDRAKEDSSTEKKPNTDFQEMAAQLSSMGALKPVEGTPGLFTIPSFSTPKEQARDITERMTYRDLVGYESAIEVMRRYGIGMQNDPEFKELVDTLNLRHGLDRIPATDSFLIQSPIREDANQFMLATMGELNLPAVRMRMEENLQGMPVLCVMTASDNQPRLNAARNAIEGGGVLILEDIDMWGIPSSIENDEMGGFMYAQLSRGAREAMNMIRMAIENPEVYVLMSASKDSQIDSFFHEILGPLTVIDVEYPTASERADLWSNIVKEHPSLRQVDRGMLVRSTDNMSRYDIYMAAREAVEDAYKESLIARKYISVNAQNLFEKIAAYQPLDSDQYRQLEDAVIDQFRGELDNLDDILKGESDA